MKIEKIKINNIPSIVWGEKSSKVFIAIHGNMSNKEDEVIKILAKEVVSKGYQLLSFDLPEHGERKEDTAQDRSGMKRLAVAGQPLQQ